MRTELDKAIAPAWEAMRKVDRLTADPDIRRAISKVRDALREIEIGARRES